MVAEKAGRRRIGLLAVVLVMSYLHFALGPAFDAWFARPNLLLCALLVAARQLRPAGAAGLGFALGLLEDAVAVSHFGLATLLLVLLGYIGSLTRDLFVGEELLFVGTYVFVGTWVYETASYLILGAGGSPLTFVFARAPLDALATGGLSYLISPFVRAR